MEKHRIIPLLRRGWVLAWVATTTLQPETTATRTTLTRCLLYLADPLKRTRKSRDSCFWRSRHDIRGGRGKIFPLYEVAVNNEGPPKRRLLLWQKILITISSQQKWPLHKWSGQSPSRKRGLIFGLLLKTSKTDPRAARNIVSFLIQFNKCCLQENGRD